MRRSREEPNWTTTTSSPSCSALDVVEIKVFEEEDDEKLETSTMMNALRSHFMK